jgi:hypothetical protein
MKRGAWIIPLVVLAWTGPVQARVRCTTVEHRHQQRLTYFSDADRPTKSNVLRSASGRASVHWDPAQVTEAHAQLALTILEQALQMEVDQMGWPAPIPDRTYGGDSGLDLYFDPQPDGSAYTAPDPEDPGLPRDASMAYVVLDTATTEAELPSFIYHEVNHVLQFGADPGEADSIFEATASFIEYVTRPEAVFDTNYMPAFQGAPADAMDDFSHANEFSYGYSLFLFFVAQRYFGGAPEIIRDLWVGSAQYSPGAYYVNEPDYLDVLHARLPDVPLSDVLAEFSRWRSFMGTLDDGMHVQLPAPVPPGSTMRRTASLTPEMLPYSHTVSLAETGSALWVLTVDTLVQGAVRVEVHGGTAVQEEAEVSLIATAAQNQVVASLQARGADPVAVLATSGASHVRVILARLGDGAHDPDDEEWGKHDYSITVTAVDETDAGTSAEDAGSAQTPDAAAAGSGGDAPPDNSARQGCGGCGAAGQGPPAWLGALWLLVRYHSPSRKRT